MTVQPLAKQYSRLHLIVASGIATLVLAAISAGLSMISSHEAPSLIDFASQGMALVIVCGAYASPFLGGSHAAPLSHLAKADKRLLVFAATGFVAFLFSPLMFPKGSLSVESATNQALSALGISAVLVFPVSIAVHTTLILVARHIKPIFASTANRPE